MIIGFLAVICCISSCSFGGEDKSTVLEKTGENIEVVDEIRKNENTILQSMTKEEVKELVSKIDGDLKNCQKVDTTVFGYSSEGTELIGYFQNNVFKKIVAKHAGEYGNLIESIYFNEDELILIIWDETYYDKPIFEQGVPKSDSTAKEYFYFEKKELEEWLKNEDKVKKEDNNYEIQEKRFNEDIAEYLKALRAKLN